MPGLCRRRFLAVAILLGLGAGSARAASAERPNIVLIVADDLPWKAVGYHGSFIRTPNIDRLAQQGVQLDRFYVSPMCSPTRHGLLTGRYPMRFGMARSVVRPWSRHGLPPEENTLAELLARAGYRHRGVFGKWHLGHLAPQWHPLSQGFTQFVGLYNGAGDYWNRTRDGQPDWHRNGEPLEQSGYTTDLIADAACRFIQQHAAEGPFFCYVPFSAPHEPVQAPDSYLEQYPEANAEARLAADVRTLAAMVTCMDDGVGRILRTLESSGVARQTLVWFLSDNGGVTRFNLNGELREGKLTVYEGGVRVVSAVSWPGVIEGGRKVTEPIVNVDLLPTLLRACGAAAPDKPALDGVDVLDVLRGRSASAQKRDLYFFTGQAGLPREQIAVTSPEGWKLVVIGPDVRRPEGYRTEGHTVQLFNVLDDPSERRDLADGRPELVERLGKKLIAFRASEPADSMPPLNNPPPGFKPPHRWRNSPIARPGSRAGETLN